MFKAIIQIFGLLFLTTSWLNNDHYLPWLNFHAETLAVSGLGCLFVSYLIKNSNKNHLLLPTCSVIVLLVLLIPWTQYVVSIGLFAGDVVMVSIYLFSLTASITLSYNALNQSLQPGRTVVKITIVLCLAASLSAVIGLLQWFELTEAFTVYIVQTEIGDRAMGNLGQPNQLATLILIGLIASIWMYEQGYLNVAGIVAITVLLTLGLVLAQSRTSLLSVVTLIMFFAWQTRTKTLRLKLRWILYWTVIFGYSLYLLPFAADFLLLSPPRDLNPPVDSGRIVIWSQMISGIQQSPWFGYGWNQTETAHAAGSIKYPGSLVYTNAHNIQLDLMVWNGIPIGLLIGILCIYWLISRLKDLKSAIPIYAYAAMLPLLVHSLLEYPFAYTYFLIIFGFMVGVVEFYHPKTNVMAVSSRWVIATLACWCIGCSLVAYEYVLIEKDFEIVRFENLRVGITPSWYEVPKIRVLTHMGALLDAARTKPTPNMSIEKLENLRKASLRFSYGPVDYRYALALALNGDPASASTQMQIIKGVYGQRYYNATVSSLRELQQEYPQLSLVELR